MKQMCDGTVFQSGNHQLTVIHTDLREAESLIRCIAEKESEAYPHSLEGQSPYVYFKMPYIQPCDNFKELRRLILWVRQKTGLRANYRGIVAIEATEWIGHEREEYFTVLLKYLYDHRDIWQAAMILKDCNPAQLQRFTEACVRYMTPKLVQIRVFENAATLFGVLQVAFENRSAHISHTAVSMLAEVMVKPELKEARNLEFIERIVAEVITYRDEPLQITEDHVKDYLMESCSMLAMMSGSILYEERGTSHEEESLYL